ncbi:MAG: SAM-dependent methyltransferase [Pseudomonadota bacterium]|nr:MAG: SAM-dependent methyltransferase [Pseudomonadota bacterium]
MGPLVTLAVHETLCDALRSGSATVRCSLDLGRSTEVVHIDAEGWCWNGRRFPYLTKCKDRTVYYWTDAGFQPVARFTKSLVKLVPTEWGPPTFEIDGIKMLPTAEVSPYTDAEHKVRLIQPRGKLILDSCGGLGYFAAWCLQSGARRVLSYEKSPDVLWLRSLNPWSPASDERLMLTVGDITEHIAAVPSETVDAVLHDPPRFGTAGELYSQMFYDELARVLKRAGKLFHYTGIPNKLTSNRDVPNEVAKRLRQAGFVTEPAADGVLARRR